MLLMHGQCFPALFSRFANAKFAYSERFEIK